MQTATPAARPPQVHPTYLSPQGQAAIAAHAAALRQRRAEHAALVETQRALQLIWIDITFGGRP